MNLICEYCETHYVYEDERKEEDLEVYGIKFKGFQATCPGCGKEKITAGDDILLTAKNMDEAEAKQKLETEK